MIRFRRMSDDFFFLVRQNVGHCRTWRVRIARSKTHLYMSGVKRLIWSILVLAVRCRKWPNNVLFLRAEKQRLEHEREEEQRRHTVALPRAVVPVDLLGCCCETGADWNVPLSSHSTAVTVLIPNILYVSFFLLLYLSIKQKKEIGKKT